MLGGVAVTAETNGKTWVHLTLALTSTDHLDSATRPRSAGGRAASGGARFRVFRYAAIYESYVKNTTRNTGICCLSRISTQSGLAAIASCHSTR
jgi:hypothetical protein